MSALVMKRDRQLVIVTLVVAAVIFWLYYAYLFQPLLRKVTELEHNISNEHIKLEHIQQLITQEPKLREEYEQLFASMQSLRTSMPAEHELAAVIEQLSGMATQAGVKIQTIFPQRSLESFKVVAGLDQKQSDPRAKLYKEIPIQIDARAGFHQLGAFLNRVERGRQPMLLKTLRISGSAKEPRRHEIEMVLIGYFAVSENKTGSDAAAPGR